MVKFIRRIIIIVILILIGFLGLSLWRGGGPFRWFGAKSEQAGTVVKETSEELGNEADKIKEKTGAIKKSTRRVSEGLKKTGEKVREITRSKER